MRFAHARTRALRPIEFRVGHSDVDWSRHATQLRSILWPLTLLDVNRLRYVFNNGVGEATLLLQNGWHADEQRVWDQDSDRNLLTGSRPAIAGLRFSREITSEILSSRVQKGASADEFRDMATEVEHLLRYTGMVDRRLHETLPTNVLAGLSMRSADSIADTNESAEADLAVF
ncbi:hypothetical protein BAUCODRAFT_492960 [Baudoinia panamericana UAMH 10762]|uniref:Uncharacterized protein n=1 Tax=Baudoinia panamericana (strain UAMH 10762) TaxID=717646 RepID=M2N9Q4_BAUPA|nr:uncharacterized protein BAUCODRAFT_492960 [Baudoinia panamericana UAMH 10762]EMC95530.1 hypothetical protein BAUCODRAFT_492960 [Baudoinia panamericana UAMH 10762]